MQAAARRRATQGLQVLHTSRACQPAGPHRIAAAPQRGIRHVLHMCCTGTLVKRGARLRGWRGGPWGAVQLSQQGLDVLVIVACLRLLALLLLAHPACLRGSCGKHLRTPCTMGPGRQNMDGARSGQDQPALWCPSLLMLRHASRRACARTCRMPVQGIICQCCGPRRPSTCKPQGMHLGLQDMAPPASCASCGCGQPAPVQAPAAVGF